MGKIADAISGLSLPQQKQAQMLRFDREFEALEKEVQRLRTQVQNLEAQVNPLQREVDRLKADIKRDAAPELTFDQRTGTYTEAGSSLRYCAKCYADGKKHPLRDTGHGWHCMACGTRVNDASRPRPTYQARTDWDPFGGR